MKFCRTPLITTLALVVLSTLFLAPTAKAANDGSGWYVGGDLGLDIPTNRRLNSAGSTVMNDYGTGVVVGFNGGYTFSNGLRSELEFNYHHTNVNDVTVTSPYGSASQSGNVTGYQSASILLADLWYEFKQSEGFMSVVYPYVGAGIGVAEVSIDSESFHSFSGTQGSANGSGTAFAYQIGFGVNYDISTNFEASADFRYLMTTSVSIPSQNPGGSGDINGVSGTYREPSLLVGLRYKFGESD